MNKTTTHGSIKGPHLFVIAALLGGLALALGVVLLAQAAPATALQFDPPVPTILTLLPDQATNTLPADTSHQFVALVLSQFILPMAGVQVSFSTDSGQFQGDGQYVEVATDLAGEATVTVISTTVGTAHIRAWIDGNGNNTYDTGEELTDDPSTKTWQETEHPDFGDAPDSYGTLSATIGARHTITPLHHLGLTVDGEPDGQPSPNADGDDLNASPDEDGVALQPILVPGTTAIVLVNGGPSGGKLDAWIDFNKDGDFDHTSEHLWNGTSKLLAMVPPNLPDTLTFDVPAGAITGTTYARFRLSTAGSLPPTGPAPDGEVEDYLVLIQELPEGAGTIVLQKKTDPPSDIYFDFLDDFGIPGFSLSLFDGMSLSIPGIPAPFTYTITETLPIGWELTGIDCETDDPEDTSSWSSNSITIDMDVGETITCTFNNAELGTIVLRKRTIPPGGIGFEFTDPFGIGLPSFSIDDGDTLPIPFVPAGTYTVTEADPIPFGFDLIDVDCEDPDGGSSIDLDARTATIDLDAGETITCTFTNRQRGTIVVEKQTDPDGVSGTFSFSDTVESLFTFELADDGTQPFYDVISGTYTITETNPAPAFDLTDITCSDGNSIGDEGTGEATVSLQPGETVTCTFTNTVAARPTGKATDSVGVGQYTYRTDEIVYATGGGFTPNTNVNVYIVGDRAWNDGDPIPADVSSDGMNPGVPTDATGDLGPADVWPPPLTPGEYDMVFDANQNGVYNAGVDVVDDPNHPGFVVQAPPPPPVPVGGIAVLVNKLELLVPWLGLAALAALATLTVALVRRRRS